MYKMTLQEMGEAKRQIDIYNSWKKRGKIKADYFTQHQCGCGCGPFTMEHTLKSKEDVEKEKEINNAYYKQKELK